MRCCKHQRGWGSNREGRRALICMGWEYIAEIQPGHKASQKRKKPLQPLYLAAGKCWRAEERAEMTAGYIKTCKSNIDQ